MTTLARPDVRLCDSWAAALLEFGSEQVHGSGNIDVPLEVRSSTAHDVCAYVVAELERRADPSVPLEPDMVRSDYFWITDAVAGGSPVQEHVVGFVATRHDLNAFLLETGGHIGYSVRPSRRGQGHAGRALRLALEHVAGLGLERVLITCDEDNEPSRRTIESAGGVLEDVRERTMRFWVELGQGRRQR
jgi:predicted acetyltransferase